MATRRARLLIAAGAAVAAILAVAALVTHWQPDASRPANELLPERMTAQAYSRIDGLSWERVPWPTVAGNTAGWLSYVTAPDDPQKLYACALAVPQGTSPRIAPLHLFITGDGGVHWSPSHGLSDIAASQCELRMAPDASNELALLATRQVSVTDCPDYDLYVSHDSGQTWRKTPSLPPAYQAPPEPQTLSYCVVHMLAASRHLYVLTYAALWATTTSGGSSEPQPARIDRSNDGGITWQRISGPPFFGQAWPLLLSDGQSLLATEGVSLSDGKRGLRLSASSDAGATWRAEAILVDGMGAHPQLPFGTAATTPTGSSPWYLGMNDQTPSHFFRIQVAQIAGGSHYQLLPPLLVPGATPARNGITTVLGATGSANLLVLGLGPNDTVPPEGTGDDDRAYTQQWLWEWDPHSAQWALFGTPLPQPWPECSAACFQAHFSAGLGPSGQGLYLWLSSSAGEPLYRAFLPREAW
ncbi:MAG TPA: sialidase family protein [Ktedonobacterales bacterium]